jgi:SAM-dependent methyltransferase
MMKEFWNERFLSKEYYYGTRPNHFLTTVIGILPSKAKILCIGEGEGRNAVYLSSLGFDVTAVDYSIEGKNKAMALASAMNVSIKYEISALENFNFEVEQWDAVVSVFCHLPPDIRPLIHKKIEHSLAGRGFFVIQAYNPRQLEFKSGGPKDIAMLYTADLLKSDFLNLDWLKLESNILELSEGIGHQGMSSVISGVALRSFSKGIKSGSSN